MKYKVSAGFSRIGQQSVSAKSPRGLKIVRETVFSRAMSVAPSPADLEQGGDGLVEMERELIGFLLVYDEPRTAWPKGRHVLVRAEIGRQVADALARIDDLEHVIASTPARTLPEAAVRHRRLSALMHG